MMHFERIAATGETKHTVLLLHAFPLNTGMWRPMVKEHQSLRDDTAFILVDFPGLGKSPVAEWTMESFAKELAKALQTETAPVILGGLSMGGYAALAFVRDFPELVSALVLSNTKSQADTAEELRGREANIEQVRERGGSAVAEWLIPKFFTGQAEPGAVEQTKQWMIDAKPEAIINAINSMSERHDTTPVLSKIKVPVLLIASTNDEITPPGPMQKMASNITDGTYFEIDATAHCSAMEKPRDWARTLSNFIDGL